MNPKTVGFLGFFVRFFFFLSICQILLGHLPCLRAFEAKCISLGNKSHQKLKINNLEELITS